VIKGLATGATRTQKKQGTTFSAAPCSILLASLDPTPSLAWSGIGYCEDEEQASCRRHHSP
jgi:hypothetical protein